MTDSNDSHIRAGTSSGNSENEEILQPFVLRPDEIYPKQYLDKVMKLSKNTWTKWKLRGLKPLNTNTKHLLYSGFDLIELFRSSE